MKQDRNLSWQAVHLNYTPDARLFDNPSSQSGKRFFCQIPDARRLTRNKGRIKKNKIDFVIENTFYVVER